MNTDLPEDSSSKLSGVRECAEAAATRARADATKKVKVSTEDQKILEAAGFA